MSFGEDFKFTYKDEASELVKKVFASDENRNAALEGFCKGLQSTSAGSDDLNPFRLLERGKFNNILFTFFIFFICLARFSFDLGL